MRLSFTYNMKATKESSNGKATSHFIALLARAESTEKLVDAARSQWRIAKLEQKQARKAFKQARKAAKSARKEIKAVARDLKRKGIKLPKPLKPATLSKYFANKKPGKSPRKVSAANANGRNSVGQQSLSPQPPQPTPVQLRA
jgi:hypothetical protein